MNATDLCQKYPKFIYEKYSYEIIGDKLEITYYYSLPFGHKFVHRLTFQNLKHLTRKNIDARIIFSTGIIEAANYWKTTCSPVIEIQAGWLPIDEKWWQKLYLNGFSQYFYENHIDYTPGNFLSFNFSGPEIKAPQVSFPEDSILLPIGGGKDSAVSGELLKSHFSLQPVIVYPASPAADKIAEMLSDTPAITVTRNFDPHLMEMNNSGYLNGHVPYSAIIGFLFLIAAQIDHHKYIVVSNERSSDEGNVIYLGKPVNHQYSKSSEFEADFSSYIQSLGLKQGYFSFLRPLYELQIAQLFSRMPRYFDTFRSCNKGQKENMWCGHCPKCLSVAMALGPWTGEDVILKIFSGVNPLNNPDNAKILKEMTDPAEVKPFECITTTEEAQICLEFIEKGQTPGVREFLSHRGPSVMPEKFTRILNSAIQNLS